jgi:hypothetical protein
MTHVFLIPVQLRSVVDYNLLTHKLCVMHYVGSRILILHSMIRYEYCNHFATQLYV